MASLRGYFDTDFNHDISAVQSRTVSAEAADFKVEIVARLHFDFDSNAKYASFFVPATDQSVLVCTFLLEHVDLALSLSDGAEVRGGLVGEDLIRGDDLPFSGRVFIYCDNALSVADRRLIYAAARAHDLSLRLRDVQHDAERAKLEVPLAFISHDSRDKDDVARPLAIQLSIMMCPVWFDEFSLRVGESLRESIETGLKQCRKCIIVLSPQFFANKGWTRAEFNSIFAREIIEKSGFILPVWHGVTRQEVFEYCPSLADKFGVAWDLGVREVARRLYKVIMP